MENFIFNLTTKVYFGPDQLDCNLAEVIKQYGQKVLLVYGGGSIKKTGLYNRLMGLLEGFQVDELADVEPNPRSTTVDKGAKICKEKGIDVILAVGGGSTIDCSKIISATAKRDCCCWDIVKRKEPIEQTLPLVTILTLSATGSEMNVGAVISNTQTAEKQGVGSPLLAPKVSFLDPTLTYTVSAYQTACGSADILSHIMETYFDYGNMDMLLTMMEGLMRTVIQYAPIAMENPTDYQARANLMWASSWGISPLIRATQEKSWSVHSMEHQLSAVYDITHGLGLAILTPRWMRFVKQKDTKFEALLARFGRNVFGLVGEDADVAERAIHALEDFLFQTLKLQSNLSSLQIDETHFDEMALKAMKNGVLAGIIDLYPEDVKKIYQMSL